MTPDLSYVDLAIVSALVVCSVVLVLLDRLGLVQDIVVSCMRAFIQLTVVGVLLGALFSNARFYWVALALLVMIGAAVQAGRARVEGNAPGLTINMSIAIGLISVATLVFVVGLVVRPDLWYEPQIVIPLAGMTVGNTMTASTLAANRFIAELRLRQDDVEALLALGATSEQAVADVFRDSVRSALIPSIAGMMVVGLVSLPGMMTGQILAGQDPGQAVRYQLVVQYMLLFAAVATSSLIVRLTRRRFFTESHQLRWQLLRPSPIKPMRTWDVKRVLARIQRRE